jgi:hypothetical protein
MSTSLSAFRRIFASRAAHVFFSCPWHPGTSSTLVVAPEEEEKGEEGEEDQASVA